MSIEFLTKTVNVSVEGRVATIQLNRPESLNAINEEMINELIHNLKELANSDDVQIVVLTGNERAFSSGGDIKTMVSREGTEESFNQVIDKVNDLAVTLYSLPKVTISAISGAAAGLGFSLALATDYIIAQPKSKLAMNFIGIGLIPDGGGHFFVEKKIGTDKAKKLIWDGKILSGEEALQLQLIDEVSEDVRMAVEKKINEWLNKPLLAMIETKKILVEKTQEELIKTLELEKRGQFKMKQTGDHKEGIRAFLEKRPAKFTGQ